MAVERKESLKIIDFLSKVKSDNLVTFTEKKKNKQTRPWDMYHSWPIALPTQVPSWQR